MAGVSRDGIDGAVVLDAGILIAHLDASDAHHVAVERFLTASAAARLLASALTVAECMVRPAARAGAAAVDAALAALGLERVPLEGAQAQELARVGAETGLRMPDAVAVHAAEGAGAGIATTDRAVAAAASARGIAAHLVLD